MALVVCMCMREDETRRENDVASGVDCTVCWLDRQNETCVVCQQKDDMRCDTMEGGCMLMALKIKNDSGFLCAEGQNSVAI